MRKYLSIVFLIFFVIELTSCNESLDNQLIDDRAKLPASIGDISYDYNKSWDYHVYIEENGNYIPFIVLSSDYNGYCLLLREYLLDDLIEYNSPGEYGSYYKDSNIDKYLNDVYYFNFSEKIRNLIYNSQIEITTKNAIDTHNNETEIISRKVFILSANEVNASLGSIFIKEGTTLSYFENIKNRVALHENGKSDSWMLRTPALSGGNNLIGVGIDGSVGIGGINGMEGINKSSVRPAFCIPSETKIIQKNNIIEGQKVFCIQ